MQCHENGSFQGIIGHTRHSEKSMGSLRYFSETYRFALYGGTSARLNLSETDELPCEWRAPVRQGIGRKLQEVSARFRPGFPSGASPFYCNR
jgi:hypothetical protein